MERKKVDVHLVCTLNELFDIVYTNVRFNFEELKRVLETQGTSFEKNFTQDVEQGFIYYDNKKYKIEDLPVFLKIALTYVLEKGITNNTDQKEIMKEYLQNELENILGTHGLLEKDGHVSKNLVGQMATLIRPPEARGGARSIKK